MTYRSTGRVAADGDSDVRCVRSLAKTTVAFLAVAALLTVILLLG